MKKLTMISLVLLGCIAMLSFIGDKDNLQEITITVTSECQTEFDMYQSVSPHQTSTTTGLKTPYKTTISVGDGKFIFRQRDANAKLLIDFSTEAIKLTADWPITVVLVENNSLRTFGMN